MDVNPESGNRKPEIRLRIKERGLTVMERQAIQRSWDYMSRLLPPSGERVGSGATPRFAGTGSQILAGVDRVHGFLDRSKYR